MQWWWTGRHNAVFALQCPHQLLQPTAYTGSRAIWLPSGRSLPTKRWRRVNIMKQQLYVVMECKRGVFSPGKLCSVSSWCHCCMTASPPVSPSATGSVTHSEEPFDLLQSIVLPGSPFSHYLCEFSVSPFPCAQARGSLPVASPTNPTTHQKTLM